MLKKCHRSVVSIIAVLFFILPTHAAEIVVRDIVFPVNGPSSFHDDYGDPRDGGAREHLGVDIIADKMTPVVSAVNGRVTYAPTSQPSWGYTISIQDSEGYTYRYLHLNNDNPGTDDGKGGAANAYAPGIRRGISVKKGQHVGFVGDSGNAEGTLSHLHFEIRNGRTVINPYSSLVKAAEESLFSASIRVGGGATTSHPSAGDLPIADLEYFFAENLSIGSRGEAVIKLQTRLKSEGHFTSTVTDYFGPITQAAVVKYQIEKMITPANGIVGEATRGALNGGAVVAPVIAPYVFTQNLSVGAQGEQVRQLQIRLASLGFFDVSPTSYFGSITKSAVMKFQTAMNITPTGVVELITRSYLNGCSGGNKYSIATGELCSGISLPQGCTSTSGYSTATGQACGSSLLPGCTSTTGYSSTTGKACWNLSQ